MKQYDSLSQNNATKTLGQKSNAHNYPHTMLPIVNNPSTNQPTIFTCRGDVQKVTSTPYGALPGDSGAPVMPGTSMTRVAEIQCNSRIENIYKKYHKIICGGFNYYYIILSSLYISGNKIDTLICREFLTRNSSRSRFVRSKSWTFAMLW